MTLENFGPIMGGNYKLKATTYTSVAINHFAVANGTASLSRVKGKPLS